MTWLYYGWTDEQWRVLWGWARSIGMAAETMEDADRIRLAWLNRGGPRTGPNVGDKRLLEA